MLADLPVWLSGNVFEIRGRRSDMLEVRNLGPLLGVVLGDCCGGDLEATDGRRQFRPREIGGLGNGGRRQLGL